MSEGFTPSFTEYIKPELAKDFNVGYFVFHEDTKTLAFQDAQQREIDISRILFLTREWDFNNGEKNLPKPYLIDENGAIKEYGSNLIYSYLNSSESRIVIFGAVQDFGFNHVDAALNPKTTDYEGIQEKHVSRNNKKRFFTVTEDGKGNVFVYLKGKKGDTEENTGTGSMGIKISGTDNHGNLSLTLNGKFVVTQTQTDGETETPIAQLLFDNTKDAEKIKIVDKAKNIFLMNKDGIVLETAAIRIGKDQTLKKILDKLIDAITKITQNSPSGPTISPPLNMAQFAALKQEIADFMDKQ